MPAVTVGSRTVINRWSTQEVWLYNLQHGNIAHIAVQLQHNDWV